MDDVLGGCRCLWAVAGRGVTAVPVRVPLTAQVRRLLDAEPALSWDTAVARITG